MGYAYKNHYEMKKARLVALDRNSGKCMRCGESASVVHHVDGSIDNHNVDNLVPMCSSCHTKLHYAATKTAWDSQRVKYEMSARGWDVKDLAERIEMTSAIVYRILKTGKTKNSTMAKVANAFNLDVKDFILKDSF